MPVYYLDKDGNQQDAELHNEILSEGDESVALATSKEVEEELLQQSKRGTPFPPYNLRDGWYIDRQHQAYIIIDGELHEVDYPSHDVENLDPGWYNMDLDLVRPVW